MTPIYVSIRFENPRPGVYVCACPKVDAVYKYAMEIVVNPDDPTQVAIMLDADRHPLVGSTETKPLTKENYKRSADAWKTRHAVLNPPRDPAQGV